MPNRILKDSIWGSPSLAKLDDFIQDQFPRWLLMADDWGCFDADVEIIKGLVYPRRARVTAKTVDQIRDAFYDAGLLFCWTDSDRVWGFWTSWDEHNYCNGSTVENDGKYSKRRRKTPEPPMDLLDRYIKEHLPTTPDNIRRFPTSSDKFLDPDPNPDPDSNHDLEISVPNGTLVAQPQENEAKPLKIAPRTLMLVYNDERGGLPECAELTRDRNRKCEARIRARSRDPAFLDKFRESVRRSGNNPFMCGSGERGWIASFDWFIANDTNFQKVLEGKYDGNGRAKVTESAAEARQRRIEESTNRVLSGFGDT